MPDTARPITLPANLALYVITPLALNGLIFSQHWQQPHPANPMLPPGWAVGSIWMLLFAGMGTARWIARLISPAAARWIDALAILCLLYPLYTAGLSNDRSGLIGAVVTAVVAVVAIARIQRSSKIAAIFTAPVFAWLVYASAALAVGLMRGTGS